MQPLFAFLKLPFDPSLLESKAPAETMRDLSKYTHLSNVMDPISTDSIGKGRTALTHEQKQTLQKVIGADLARLGYAPLA